jgi:hypothetical protein
VRCLAELGVRGSCSQGRKPQGTTEEAVVKSQRLRGAWHLDDNHPRRAANSEPTRTTPSRPPRRELVRLGISDITISLGDKK